MNVNIILSKSKNIFKMQDDKVGNALATKVKSLIQM